MNQTLNNRMELMRKMFYSPSINQAIRSLITPIKSLIPEALQFPPSGLIRVKIEDNKELLIITNQTDYVTKLLYWGGVENYEYSIFRIFRELIKISDTFIDVGANIGLYSLLAAKLNPNIRVLAFEPSPGCLHHLKRNIDLNNLNRNIEVFNYALSDEEGEKIFKIEINPKAKYLEHHLGGTSGFNEGSKRFNWREIKVRTNTLNNIWEEYGSGTVDLMKLDTEATEHLVLRKADKVLCQRPIIINEVLKDQIEKELEKIYKSNGYKFFKASEEGLIQCDTLMSSDLKADFFIVPHEKIMLIEEFII